jgi:tetratricopeptide (TPR) repeat protein
MYATKAGLAHRQFDLKDAVANYERALRLAEEAGDQPMWVANLHRYLAFVYSALNEPDKAVLHANEGVRLSKQLYAPDHPSIASAMDGLAAALLSKQDYEGAAKVREEIVATLRSTDAPKYALAQALNSLAIAYQPSGKIDLAISRTEEACAAYREVYGTENARTAEAMGNLARLYADAGQTGRADSLFLAALGVFGRLDPKGFFTAYTRMRYANLCRDTRRLVRADSLYLAAEAALDSTQVGQRAYLGECFTDHAYLLSLQGRHTEAQVLIPVGVALQFEGTEERSPELGGAYVRWALVSARAGRPEIAIEKLRLAAGCGVPAESVVAYPELASLRGRADYPFVSSP